MILKRKTQNPQDLITAGMVFFLIGISASMIADGRLIGAFFISLIPDESVVNTLQGFADGFSLPMFLPRFFSFCAASPCGESGDWAVDHSDNLWHNSPQCSKQTGNE